MKNEIMLWSQSHRAKVFKVQEGRNFYYNKLIRGDEDYLANLRQFLQKRKEGFIMKRQHFKNQSIRQQMVNEERILIFRSEWIHSTSILEKLNNQSIDNRFAYMDEIIKQLVVKLLIGPNQFFYSQSNLQALYGVNQEHFCINYQSTLGFQLANQSLSICKCQLNQCLSLLTHANFNQGRFKGLNIQNKFRAIAILIINLIQNQSKIVTSHQQMSLGDISNKIDKSQQSLKQIVKQRNFIQQIKTFQEEAQKDYYYFIHKLIYQGQILDWNEVIDILIMPYHQKQQDHHQSFGQIVSKTARMLFFNQPPYIKEKFIKSGIVQAGQEPDCELYLNIKLSRTSKDLLFLLKFKRLSDLLDYTDEDHQKEKQRVLKLFFQLVMEIKKRQETTTNPEQQSRIFNKQQLDFISQFSKTYGISSAQKYNQTIHILSPHSIILHRFMNL